MLHQKQKRPLIAYLTSLSASSADELKQKIFANQDEFEEVVITNTGLNKPTVMLRTQQLTKQFPTGSAEQAINGVVAHIENWV